MSTVCGYTRVGGRKYGGRELSGYKIVVQPRDDRVSIHVSAGQPMRARGRQQCTRLELPRADAIKLVHGLTAALATGVEESWTRGKLPRFARKKIRRR
jgi:hypothetical protein